ncbi:hypothetical protein CLV30_12520 [Haloactinopolyspora alba]|uniref:Uncharacterized protein n=1 Tax=Haloactinopolyspora alba TaxID=648780 RepID=A0A2P8DHE4_9ACTN|nr:hypothetical protein [Haloactinopolyspora alba]PSK96640.1 hypothetical protein CLV30_12520 [Haloactinopolyspora alba]
MTSLVPAQTGAAADLATFARRVSSFEPDAVVRIVSYGAVVGCFAETPFDALALRAVALAEPAEIDVVVEAGTLAARAVGAGGVLELPPPLPALRWASSLPPRTGWTELQRLPTDAVVARVDEGIEEFKSRAGEVADGSSPRAGRAALEGLATEIWDRELAAGVPLRLAHAASSYGFMPGADDSEVVLREAGAWWRFDAPNGAVLARSGPALFAL